LIRRLQFIPGAGGMRISFHAQEKLRQSCKYTPSIALVLVSISASAAGVAALGQQQARRVLHQQFSSTQWRGAMI